MQQPVPWHENEDGGDHTAAVTSKVAGRFGMAKTVFRERIGR
jgi:hypothetical protein